MRRAVIKAAVRPILIELLSPGADLPASVPEISEPLCVQALVSQPAVKAFDVGVLNRFARLDMDQFNTLIDSPGQEVSRGQFAAVVIRIRSGYRVGRSLHQALA